MRRVAASWRLTQRGPADGGSNSLDGEDSSVHLGGAASGVTVLFAGTTVARDERGSLLHFMDATTEPLFSDECGQSPSLLRQAEQKVRRRLS
jgi:hypothetical protein